MAVQLLLSAVYLHTEDRHLGGNNDVTVQINSSDFSVGDTTETVANDSYSDFLFTSVAVLSCLAR